MEAEATYTAFAGQRLLASGPIKATLLKVKGFVDGGGQERVLIFEDRSGIQTEFDLRGSADEVLARVGADPAFLPAEAPSSGAARPGRPKLGVVSREISLLPRHWEWLDRQPNGASAALRRLIEAAKKSGQGQERARVAREAAAKFMWVMAGNLPDFEEASRALYAKDDARLSGLIAAWPGDIRSHTQRLVEEAARLEALAAEAAPAAS